MPIQPGGFFAQLCFAQNDIKRDDSHGARIMKHNKSIRKPS